MAAPSGGGGGAEREPGVGASAVGIDVKVMNDGVDRLALSASALPAGAAAPDRGDWAVGVLHGSSASAAARGARGTHGGASGGAEAASPVLGEAPVATVDFASAAVEGRATSTDSTQDSVLLGFMAMRARRRAAATGGGARSAHGALATTELSALAADELRLLKHAHGAETATAGEMEVGPEEDELSTPAVDREWGDAHMWGDKETIESVVGRRAHGVDLGPKRFLPGVSGLDVTERYTQHEREAVRAVGDHMHSKAREGLLKNVDAERRAALREAGVARYGLQASERDEVVVGEAVGADDFELPEVPIAIATAKLAAAKTRKGTSFDAHKLPRVDARGDIDRVVGQGYAGLGAEGEWESGADAYATPPDEAKTSLLLRRASHWADMWKLPAKEAVDAAERAAQRRLGGGGDGPGGVEEAAAAHPAWTEQPPGVGANAGVAGVEAILDALDVERDAALESAAAAGRTPARTPNTPGAPGSGGSARHHRRGAVAPFPEGVPGTTNTAVMAQAFRAQRFIPGAGGGMRVLAKATKARFPRLGTLGEHHLVLRNALVALPGGSVAAPGAGQVDGTAVEYVEGVAVQKGPPPHLAPFMWPRRAQLPIGCRVDQVSVGNDHVVARVSGSRLEPPREEFASASRETPAAGLGSAVDGASGAPPKEVAPPGPDHGLMVDRSVGISHAHGSALFSWGERYDGLVVSMGSGRHGQTGQQHTRDTHAPELLETLTEADVRALDCGDEHTCVVTATGDVAAFGRGDGLRLGTGEEQSSSVPRVVFWVGQGTHKIKAVAAGGAHTLLLTEAQNVLAFGSNGDGQLGIGTTRASAKPVEVRTVRSLRVTAIACGSRHSLAITREGLLYAFGNNDAGQLGLGSAGDAMLYQADREYESDEEDHEELARRIAEDLARHERDAQRVLSAGDDLGDEDYEGTDTDAALRSRVTDGGSEAGEMGEGPFWRPAPSQKLPCRVRHPEWRGGDSGTEQFVSESAAAASSASLAMGDTGAAVMAVSAGEMHSVVLTSSGAVYTFGAGDRGQLGHGDAMDRHWPCCVERLSGGRGGQRVVIQQVAAGAAHTVALSKLGLVYTWGAGELAQLANGVLDDVHQPEVVRALSTVRVGQVAAGGGCTAFVLRHDGSLWTAGSTAYGRPGERNPTRLAVLMRRQLNRRDQKKVLVMLSTIDMLTPHEMRFTDLEQQTILYGPFGEEVLAHLLDALLQRMLAHPVFLHMLVRFVKSVADHALGICKYSFRRLLVDAIEHTGVHLLKEQRDDIEIIRERKANICKQNSHENGGSGTTTSAATPSASVMASTSPMTYFGHVHDKDSFERYTRWRIRARSLGRFVQEAARAHMLDGTDMADIEAACPGSLHSLHITDSAMAETKLDLFRTLVWRTTAGQGGEGHSGRSGGSQVTGARGGAGANDGTAGATASLLSGTRVYTRASEDTAYSGFVPGLEGSEEGIAEVESWRAHLQRRAVEREQLVGLRGLSSLAVEQAERAQRERVEALKREAEAYAPGKTGALGTGAGPPSAQAPKVHPHEQAPEGADAVTARGGFREGAPPGPKVAVRGVGTIDTDGAMRRLADGARSIEPSMLAEMPLVERPKTGPSTPLNALVDISREEAAWVDQMAKLGSIAEGDERLHTDGSGIHECTAPAPRERSGSEQSVPPMSNIFAPMQAGTTKGAGAAHAPAASSSASEDINITSERADFLAECARMRQVAAKYAEPPPRPLRGVENGVRPGRN